MAVKLVKPINHKKVVKITNQDFEAKMRELRVNSDIAVAVSGGPDSLALMHLSNRYALNNNINLNNKKVASIGTLGVKSNSINLKLLSIKQTFTSVYN